MISVVGIVFAGVVAAYAFLNALLFWSQDAREPPTIATAIPFVGPAFEMGVHGAKFYVRMMEKWGLPIYTLRMPGPKIYVINATALIPVVQRQSRIIAFTPMEAKAAANVMDASEISNRIIARDMTGDDGYLMSFSKAIHPAVSPGKSLDAMNKLAVQSLANSLDCWKIKGSQRVKMFKWVRHEILLATTNGVYGQHNPFRNPTIEDAWYKFEPSMMFFMLNLLPAIFTRQSYNARKRIFKAFEEYFHNGGHRDGSALVNSRYEHNSEYNIPFRDIARFELGGAFALLSNTAPTAFWIIYHIYSDTTVLEDCRRELWNISQYQDNHRIFDLSDVKSSCPVLLSTLKEVLRFHGIGVSSRIVLEDHILDNRYLLKKGNIVLIPGSVQHTMPSIWGSNVDEFHYKRFIPLDGSARFNPVAFRGFGGGTVLCPGRHFASTEILAFAALMVLKFDLEPLNGQWVRPKTDKAPMWATIPAPDTDFEVTITNRTDEEWEVRFSGSEKSMEIVAEDIVTSV